MDLSFEIQHADDLVVIELRGELDHASAASFQTSVLDALESRDADVQVRCDQLTFCDSAGARAFVAIARSAHSRGRHGTLSGMPPNVAAAFELLGIDQLFTLDPPQPVSVVDGILAVVGHSLLNSVSAVESALFILLERDDLGPVKSQEVLQLALRQAQHTSSVLRDLITAAPAAALDALNDLSNHPRADTPKALPSSAASSEGSSTLAGAHSSRASARSLADRNG